MERVKEEDGSPMESANNSENVIEMETSVMELDVRRQICEGG